MLRDVLCVAAAARDGLAVVRGAVRVARVALFSVGAGRSFASWEGSCCDWDRRASDEGDWPLELRGREAFLGQQVGAAVAADVGFAEDVQEDLFGRGLEHLQAAVRGALPRCLGQDLRVEIDSVRNVSAVSPGLTRTLQEAQPKVLGIEGLAGSELVAWAECLKGLAEARVLVHAWTDSDLGDARAFFATLLAALPPGVRALDFQNLGCPLQELPVALLPSTCVAFGTLVLQRDVNGCSARGSVAFADFVDAFPRFPQQVSIVRASLGTEGRWAHSAETIAEALREKFPGLAVLQLELSLRASAATYDVPFVDLARALVDAGVQVEVTSIRCRAAQYEFLRAALHHAGAAVHQLEDGCPPAHPFSHPRYVWPAAAAAGAGAV